MTDMESVHENHSRYVASCKLVETTTVAAPNQDDCGAYVESYCAQ